LLKSGRKIRKMSTSFEELTKLRNQLDAAFRPDTASTGYTGTVPSTGHCAAVAAIVHELFGGELVSTIIREQSHWLNRLQRDGTWFDADLTGDLFGYPPIQIGKSGKLYAGLRVRYSSELSTDTLERASQLARRAGLTSVAESISYKLKSRPGARVGNT
jgi:hypothetical protein